MEPPKYCTRSGCRIDGGHGARTKIPQLTTEQQSDLRHAVHDAWPHIVKAKEAGFRSGFVAGMMVGVVIAGVAWLSYLGHW